jgi:hypothetical protein
MGGIPVVMIREEPMTMAPRIIPMVSRLKIFSRVV